MKRALVVGLARSGRAAAMLLARSGWRVVAVDSAPVDAPDLEAAGVEVRAPWNDAVTDVDLVVKSPGVPAEADPVAAARSAGIEVIGELELAARHLPNPMIAVTGTNGKTTTTELVAHLLRESGIDAVACGNQGTPISGLVGAVDPHRWLAVECSSFQLEDLGDAFHPRAAVLLNLTPDHLDRHGTMDAYRDAKLRIFAALDPDDLAIAPDDVAIPGRAPQRTVDIDDAGARSIAWGRGGVTHADLGVVAEWDDVVLRGAHNRQNTLAAVALAAHAGATADAIARGLGTFPGVPHRLEVVGRIGDIAFVNDSKATNPDAAIAALDAYPAGVHLIAGGQAKGTSFAPLAERARGAVVHAYLIGAATRELAAAFAAAGVPASVHGDMASAVAAAAAAANPGETVLLAPACTSFDQYPNFEVRGDHFRDLVGGLGAT